jgi:hypothetical protein
MKAGSFNSMLLLAALLACFYTASACVYEYGTIQEAAVSVVCWHCLSDNSACARQRAASATQCGTLAGMPQKSLYRPLSDVLLPCRR